MKKRNQLYWLSQAGGWGAYVFLNVFLAAFVFKKTGDPVFWWRLLIFVGIGILVTHLMRFTIMTLDVLLKPLQQQILSLIIITAVFVLVEAVIETSILSSFDLWPRYPATDKPVAVHKVYLSNVFTTFVYYFIWTCLYFIYHYIEKSRKQQLDTLHLEALVKELELKTIKAHINPHFIFNSLNSIRALVDENPGRARDGITQLSNILRSSMQAEKLETVPFERELNIVKDYLALENMRFEDRLRVEYDIDDNTLGLLIPPMMLQTLVENAVKHGISKQISGGVVRVTADFKGNFLELIVQNTGHLNGYKNREGFGISSTNDRLNLLYGDKANFMIEQVSPSLVQARVLIPSNAS